MIAPKTLLLLAALLATSSTSSAFANLQPQQQVSLVSSHMMGSSSSSTATRPSITALRSGAVSDPPPPELKPPPALYQGAVAAGTAKAKAAWGKIFKLGIVSGCHIAFGAYLAITVGGACPGLAQTNPGLQKVRLFVSICVCVCE
mmetsp:Transcript_49915/g.120914  ORF Transcript_49915/g.120914 Transcript_49915/m.120914 type:complete len:145 (-) Transcript_49915:1066-1500(-)